MKHLAIGNHILVEEVKKDKLTDGGIYIGSGTVSADSMRCVVISVSEQILESREMRGNKHYFPVKIGDVIYKAFHIGTPITTVDGKKIWALHVDNILSVEVPDESEQ